VGIRSRCSGDLLPPSPPAEKSTAREDQAGQASTDDGGGDGGWHLLAVREDPVGILLLEIAQSVRVGPMSQPLTLPMKKSPGAAPRGFKTR
jgi:hypothetical protein